MDWDDPLCHTAAPISELTIIDDEDFGNLTAKLMLNNFCLDDPGYNRTASIIGPFFQFLRNEGRKVLATEIRDFVAEDEKNGSTCQPPCVGLPWYPVDFRLLPFSTTGSVSL